jgi:Kef-type K+ transport system membrane component KefB
VSDALLAKLLIDMAVIVLVAHVAGLLLARMGQPAVLGEIIGGIALGPTLLGALPGDPSTALFPATVLGPLSAIGNVGLVLFMFVAGLEVELPVLRRYDRTLMAVSLGAVALPFALGFGVAVALLPSHQVIAGHEVPFLPRALFLATALSITAFPVLVRIVGDRGLANTELGQLAIGSAAVQDIAGWLLLAVALATLHGGGPGELARIAIEAVAFTVALVVVVRPILQWACRRDRDSHDADGLALAAALVAACAAVTQAIGLHAVIGAFAVGVAFPRAEGAAAIARLRRALTPVTLGVLLPAYFLTAGLHVNLRTFDEHALWLFTVLLVCACVGKIVGSAVPARLCGHSWRTAGALGALLNARGLIELVVLGVGLSRGLVDQQLFSIMIAVAVITTLSSGPLLSWVLNGARQRDGVPALGAVGMSIEPR